VVIGGGPTGLETAGALYELLNRVLTREYAGKDLIQGEVYLVELSPNLLNTYPERLQRSALKQLRDLGVKVILDNGVQEITEDYIKLKDGTRIETRTVIWAAGVKGRHPPVTDFSFPDKILVKPTLETSDFEHIYAVGDTAILPGLEGMTFPMVIPVAQQQGILAAKNILREYKGQNKLSFQYRDRGNMATIGRKRAVAWIYNRLPVSGFLAWLAWLFLHFVTLIGFRNKLVVLISWIWSYFTYDRSVRIILDLEPANPISNLNKSEKADS
jgi:NADH dehydrogenase